MSLRTTAAALVLAFAATMGAKAQEAAPGIPEAASRTVGERYEAASACLGRLAQTSLFSRISTGGLYLGTGLAFSSVCFATMLSDGQGMSLEAFSMAGASLLLTVPGIIILAMPGKPELVQAELEAMPAGTEAELELAAFYAESALEGMAAETNAFRAVYTAISLAGGLGAIVLSPEVRSVLPFLPAYDGYYSIYPSPELIMGISFIACGLFTLVFESQEELEWRTYSDWLGGKDSATRVSAIKVSPSVAGLSLSYTIEL